MPSDPAAPERWLESQRRSDSRRHAVTRAAARRRIGRRGAVVLVAAMTLGVGGAAAQQSTGGAAAVSKAAGVSVKAIQRALGLRADGHYGPKTRRAVKRFQRAHGLAVDGVAGPATLAALKLTARQATAVPAVSAGSATLQAIALCESGGDPAAVSSSGVYRGKYQFTYATWQALGGTGDPAAAPEAEQDQRAATLLASEGTSPWPACGASV